MKFKPQNNNFLKYEDFAMLDTRKMKLAADTIRLLSADAIQKAKSGHPGMPMGCADFAFALWQNHLRHNPKNPNWLGRDRFVLSAGHGSMLLYSLLHLYGCGVSLDDLKNFRQWGSITPGHPEYGVTPGVDVSTGPLGSGFAAAVGLSFAKKHFAAATGLDGTDLMNGRIWVISGDGCMMEGTTHEAASLAGTQQLDDLIVFYDSNRISIEGETSLAFTENTAKRFEAYAWRVIDCADANDPEQVEAALCKAEISDGRPTLIVGHTKIGYGAPTREGKAKSHGEPLGEEELAGAKKNLGFDPEQSFVVPAEVAEMTAKRAAELEQEAAVWDAEFQTFLEANPDRAERISDMLTKAAPDDLEKQLLAAIVTDKPQATRASSGAVLQQLSALVPALIGGSADLGPSNKTVIRESGSFAPDDREGRNIHFGVRELAMSMISNGMALFGTALPYCATFFVFSDYMKPGIRLAAMMKLPVIYVLTHDSFYVGEDGPTHEPVEQLPMLRSTPDLTVIRPADAHETALAWAYAVRSLRPTALLLTRQDLPPFDAETAAKIDIAKGAYVISDDDGFEYLLIATGSEVPLALAAAALLRADGKKVRVVSMPSCELFLRQPAEYRDAVLPPACRKRVSIEAASTFGWDRFTTDSGLRIGLDHFGASAPYKVLAEKFGFTPDAVAEKIRAFFA